MKTSLLPALGIATALAGAPVLASDHTHTEPRGVVSSSVVDSPLFAWPGPESDVLEPMKHNTWTFLTEDEFGSVDLFDNVGTVNSVILMEDGTIDGLVADIGGLLGIGSRTVKIPIENVVVLINDEPGAFETGLSTVVRMTVEEIEALEPFEPVDVRDADISD